MADVHITPEGLEAVQKELDELRRLLDEYEGRSR